MDYVSLKQNNDQLVVQRISSTIKQPSDIKAITWLNFRYIKPEWLLDDGITYSLKLFVDGLTTAVVPEDCTEFFNWLVDLMRKSNQLPSQRPDLLAEYLRMLAVLKACFLINLDEADVEQFLREQFLYAVEVQDFDVAEKIYLFFSFFKKNSEIFKVIRSKFQMAVEGNKEFLGENLLSIVGKGNEQDPTIANWLLDYKQFSVAYAIPKRSGAATTDSKILGGSIERVAYMQKNSNVQKLNQDEKTILFKILEFYDWIRTVRPESEYVPFFSSYVQIEKFELRRETGLDAKLPAALPPIIPAPKNQPVQRSMEEIEKIPNNKFQITNEGAASPPPVTVVLKNPGSVTGQSISNEDTTSPNLSSERRGIDAESLAKPVVKPVNIEEVMKKKPTEEAFVAPGLKMWNSNPPQIPKKPTVDIDKKLEDLKKKVQK